MNTNVHYMYQNDLDKSLLNDLIWTKKGQEMDIMISYLTDV